MTSAASWRMQGDILELCSCNITCPCNYGGDPTTLPCEAVLGLRIQDGNYGNTSLGGWNFVLYGGHGISGGGFANATPFTVTMFHNGGTGARPSKDGLSATAYPSGVRNTPVEINDSIAPVRVWCNEYRTDAGGAG